MSDIVNCLYKHTDRQTLTEQINMASVVGLYEILCAEDLK